jgi:hypothetical protein
MKYALLIGINYWGTPLQLTACHRDVYNIANLLRNFFGFQEIVELTENEPSNKEMLPTKDNILRHLSLILKKMKTGDELFVYYSGHGYYIENPFSEEKDKRDELLCPLDCDNHPSGFGYIVDDTLLHMFQNTPASNLNICFIIDACHSGSICDLPFCYDGLTIQEEITSKNEHMRNNVLNISSCRDHEVSYENQIINQGIFTGTFVRYLVGLLNNQAIQTRGQKLLKHISSECISKCKTIESIEAIQMPVLVDYRTLMTGGTLAGSKSIESVATELTTKEIKPIAVETKAMGWRIQSNVDTLKQDIQAMIKKEKEFAEISIYKFHKDIAANINRAMYPQNLLVSFSHLREPTEPLLRLKMGLDGSTMKPMFQFIYK